MDEVNYIKEIDDINQYIDKEYLIKEDIKYIKKNIHCKNIMKKYDDKQDCMMVRIYIEYAYETKVIDKYVYDWSIINSEYDNILDGFYSINSCEDIRKCLKKLSFNKEKYMSLIHKDSNTFLKYDEYLIMLIYKALGMDKFKNIDRYNSILNDILNHIKNRSQYIATYENIKSRVSIDNRSSSNGLVCIKCGGTGYLEQYHEIENGVCFCCNGTGIYQGKK